MKYLLSICLIVCCWSNTDAQNIITVAGTGSETYNGDGIPATNANFRSITVSTDNAGYFYLTDGANYRIRKAIQNGLMQTIAGTGVDGYSGNGGPATNAKIGNVNSSFVNAAGDVYFTETNNVVIRKVSNTGIISLVAGVPGSGGYNGDNIPATTAKLAFPAGIVGDNAGNIYFCDVSNFCIRKINSLGIITTIAGTPNVNGYSGDGGPATAAKLENPGFLAIDKNHEALYWTEWSNKIVRKLDLITGIIYTVAGNGAYGSSGDGGPATSALLSHPNGVAVDTIGNLYIADIDIHSIRKVNVMGIISTVAGALGPGFSGDGGPSTAAQLYQPNSVAVGKDGDVYINDIGNKRVRKITFSSTGIAAIKPNTHTDIYPNPATTNITIVTSVHANTIEVTNVVGSTVVTYRPNGSEMRVDISFLPSGLYLVRVDGVYSGSFVKE